MNPDMCIIYVPGQLAELKARLKATWMTGDYDLFSRYMEADAEKFFRQLEVAPGSRLLDVACGAGQLALIAARAGARVTGCDIAANWLERARSRASAERLDIAFDEGDAESLAYPNSAFDAVVSVFGAMFAPRPELVAAELLRVCRPGGLIAMANWTPDGFIGRMLKTISKHVAPPGMPTPVLWGDEATVRERLCHGVSALHLVRRHCCFDYPFPPEAVVEFFRVNYGPMARAFGFLSDGDRQELRNDLYRLWSECNQFTNGGTRVEAEYLEVKATRSC